MTDVRDPSDPDQSAPKTLSSTATGMSFHERYSPQRFADVIGQNDVVTKLKNAVRSPGRNHFLLSGPLGTGKTTSARLIAKALNCSRPVDGDSCGTCDDCRMIESHDAQGGLLEINASGRMGNKQEVQELVAQLSQYTPLFARHVVVLWDEAQGLSTSSCNFLLNALSDCKFTVVFTLIHEAELKSAALRSRCLRVALRPSTIKERVDFLQHICRGENLHAEHDALQLIAERHPDFRNVANELETVAAATASINVNAVRDILIRTKTEPYIKYLQSLVAGDLDAQLRTIREIAAPPGDKLDSILRLLLHIKNTYVGPTILVPDRLAELAYDASTCRSVSERLNGIAGAFGQDLVSFFNEILDFWKYLPSSPTEVAAEAHIVLCHDLLAAAAPQPPRDLPRFDPAYVAPRKSRLPRVRRNVCSDTATNAYLSYEQASEIYEAGTFLLQEHKLSFDAAIEIRMTGFGIDQAEQAAAFLTDLCRNLRQCLQRKGVDHHRISALRAGSDGFAGTVLFCMSPALEIETRAWLLGYLESKVNSGASLTEAMRFEVCRQTAPKRRIDWHWMRIRDLWADVDPTLFILGKGRVVELLQIPPRNLRQPRHFQGRRLHFSQSVGQSARADAASEHLGHLSALREQAWDQLFTGWEFKEHSERQAERERRKKRIAELTEKLDASVSALASSSIKQEIERERFSWRQDARFRARREPVWGSAVLSGYQQGEDQ